MPVPGACAAVNALVASGLPTRRFAFEAFLPMEKKERRRILDSLVNETRTMIIYEAPHRLDKTLAELFSVLGNRRIAVCRELTKKHEQFFRTDLKTAATYYAENDAKGECILVIQGVTHEQLEAEAVKQWEEMTILEHLQYYMNQGTDKKEATKQVAVDRKIPKREVYEVAKTIE